MAEPGVTGGQVAPESVGTTGNAPEGNAGTSVGTVQTTGNGPDASAMESFFDPTSITGKPELEAAYKQMQGSYTKRMQEMAKHRPKIEAYERFEQDPIGTLRQLAGQYGYQFVQAGENQPKDWNPQSWDDVMAKAKQEVMKEMQPVFNEVKTLKKQNIETYLDTNHSDWRTYEDSMMENLRAHPTLVQDPDRLYRMSVPPEVLEAKAIAKAMQKLKGSQDHAQVSGGATSKQTVQAPTGPLTFDQAVEVAKQRLAGRRAAG